jgi:hypothetical protein
VSLKNKIILILSAIIIASILIFSLVLNIKNCQHQEEIENLQAQILAQTNYAVEKVDENTSAISTIETKKSISKDEVAEEIAKQIKKNKLDLVYTAQVKGQLEIKESLKGKSTKPAQIVKYEKEKEIVVTDPEIQQQCSTCLASTRIKVPFDVVQGPWHVAGYTLTPNILGDPGDYNLDVSLAKDLEFEIALTQDKKGNWKTFIYSEDFNASNIKSKISVKPFAKKWYENFLFPINIMISKDWHVGLSAGIYYKFTHRIAGGLSGGILFLNTNDSKYNWTLSTGIIVTTERKK